MKKIITICLCFLNMIAHAQYSIPDRPLPKRAVNDALNILRPATVASIEQKLDSFRKKTSMSIVLVIMPVDLGSNGNVTDYAQALFTKWGIGLAGVDNGLLFLAAYHDNKVTIRITPGNGLEQYMTDAKSGEIRNMVEDRMEARKIQHAFSDGVDSIISTLSQRVNAVDQQGMHQARAEYKAHKQADENEHNGMYFLYGLFILLICLAIVWIVKANNRAKQRKEIDELHKTVTARLTEMNTLLFQRKQDKISYPQWMQIDALEQLNELSAQYDMIERELSSLSNYVDERHDRIRIRIKSKLTELKNKQDAWTSSITGLPAHMVKLQKQYEYTAAENMVILSSSIATHQRVSRELIKAGYTLPTEVKKKCGDIEADYGRVKDLIDKKKLGEISRGYIADLDNSVKKLDAIVALQKENAERLATLIQQIEEAQGLIPSAQEALIYLQQNGVLEIWKDLVDDNIKRATDGLNSLSLLVKLATSMNSMEEQLFEEGKEKIDSMENILNANRQLLQGVIDLKAKWETAAANIDSLKTSATAALEKTRLTINKPGVNVKRKEQFAALEEQYNTAMANTNVIEATTTLGLCMTGLTSLITSMTQGSGYRYRSTSTGGRRGRGSNNGSDFEDGVVASIIIEDELNGAQNSDDNDEEDPQTAGNTTFEEEDQDDGGKSEEAGAEVTIDDPGPGID